MPNHCTNYVRIAGPEEMLASLLDRALRSEPNDAGGPEDVFDFNAIIPRPEELEITSGSGTNAGMAAFDAEAFARQAAMPWFAERFPGVTTMDEYREALAEKDPEALELGRKAIDNIARFGAPTWYEWSITHWGTKWNAYRTEVLRRRADEIVLRFETAWCPPEPIFEALDEQGFDVCCLWQEEGGGEGEWGDGAHTYFYRSRSIELG